MRVAVVGGGIAGLAAAWEIHSEADVTVYEPGRLGGRILTEDFDGHQVDAGPDAFLTRVPYALDLCAEIGVDDLVAPAAGRSLLWWGGKLRDLPPGLVLGAPREMWPVIRSGILGPAGVIRAGADLVLPRRRLPADVSVRDLIAGRFGRQVADRLVDPLVGGIHASSIDRLSAEVTVPQILQVARRSRSLMRGLRQLPSGPGPAEAIFATPRQGLGHMVERLEARLSAGGVRFEPLEVERVERSGGLWSVGPGREVVDAVVLATPAPVTAALLGPSAPAGLADARYSSVALALIACDGLELPPGYNGFLVPRSSGLLMTACSFASAKWPHWTRPGRALLRMSAGRSADDRFRSLSDERLVEVLAGELSRILRSSVAPDQWRVHRWPDAFPRYEVGHLGRVGAVREALALSHPGVVVCGSSYDGAGIPACIWSGRQNARRLVEAVRQAA